MNIAWIILTASFAGASAYLCCRLFNVPKRFPENVLVGLISFFVFLLFPIHFAATLELGGMLGSISLLPVSLLGVLPLIFIGIYQQRAIQPVQIKWAPGEYGPPPTDTVFPRYLLICIIFVLASLAVFTVNMPLMFDFGWDGNGYHIPNAIGWLQEESLRVPSAKEWKFSLPGNSEVGMMILLASGLERFVSAFNIVALVIAACGVYLLSLRAARDTTAAVMATVLFLSLPIVQFQAFSAYVDLFGTSFIIAGLAAFILRNEAGSGSIDPKRYRFMVIISCLAWGVAVGTKPTFYGFAAICFVGALFIVWRERQTHRLKLPLLMLGMAGAALLPCYFWFLRAFVATGNPIFPITVEIFGVTLFEGFSVNQMMNTPGGLPDSVSKKPFGWLTQSWVEYIHAPYTYSTGFGFGAVWATFVPLGFIFGIYLTVQSIKREELRPYAGLMFLAIIFFLLWWFGLRKLVRFGIPVLAIACVLAAPLFELLTRHRSRLFGLLLVLTVGTTTMLTAVIPLHGILGLVRSNVWSRAAVMEYPKLIDQLPKGTVIWNAKQSPLNYSLAGKDLSNKVIYRDWENLAAALKFIEEHKIEYVVDTYPLCCKELEKKGARVVLDEQVSPMHRWRVWRVRPGGSKTNISKAER